MGMGHRMSKTVGILPWYVYNNIIEDIKASLTKDCKILDTEVVKLLANFLHLVVGGIRSTSCDLCFVVLGRCHCPCEITYIFLLHSSFLKITWDSWITVANDYRYFV